MQKDRTTNCQYNPDESGGQIVATEITEQGKKMLEVEVEETFVDEYDKEGISEPEHETQKIPDFERLERAKSRDVTLMMVDEKTIVQGRSGKGHVLDTDGSEANGCSCRDWEKRKPTGGCYHMIAWSEWTFNRVAFNDGEVVEL